MRRLRRPKAIGRLSCGLSGEGLRLDARIHSNVVSSAVVWRRRLKATARRNWRRRRDARERRHRYRASGTLRTVRCSLTKYRAGLELRTTGQRKYFRDRSQIEYQGNALPATSSNLVLARSPTEKVAPERAKCVQCGARRLLPRIRQTPPPRGVSGHLAKKKPATCAGLDLLTVEAVSGEPVSPGNSLHQGNYQGNLGYRTQPDAGM